MTFRAINSRTARINDSRPCNIYERQLGPAMHCCNRFLVDISTNSSQDTPKLPPDTSCPPLSLSCTNASGQKLGSGVSKNGPALFVPPPPRGAILTNRRNLHGLFWPPENCLVDAAGVCPSLAPSGLKQPLAARRANPLWPVPCNHHQLSFCLPPRK
jgi:hypothetical protein